MSAPATVTLSTVTSGLILGLVAAWCALVFGRIGTDLAAARSAEPPGPTRPTAPTQPTGGARRAGPARRSDTGRRHSITGSSARRSQRALDRAYPDALELFVLALQSGASPVEAMRSLVDHTNPVISDAFDETCRRIDRRQVVGEALEVLVERLGSRALTLVDTIRVSNRTGLPLAPMVGRLALDAREHRRRHAEMSARELPVRLSFPLVVCTLPSFVLVAVVPLVVGAVSSLHG